MIKQRQLSKKLTLLYTLQINLEISSDSDLARQLDLSRQSINMWTRGTKIRMGDMIPVRHLQNRANLFQMEEIWST